MKNNSLKILWIYIKPYKLKLFTYIFLTILKYACTATTPILFGIAIESLTNNKWSAFLTSLIIFSILKIICFTFFEYICLKIYNFLEKVFVQKVTEDMYTKINDLPASAFEEKGVGELSNRLTTDPEKVISMFSQIIRLFSNMISFVFVFIVIIWMSLILAIETIIYIIIMLIIVYIVFPKFEKMEKENRDNADKLNKDITENVTGIREIKALGIKKILNIKISKRINNLTTSINKTNNATAKYWALNFLVYFIFEFIIFLTSAYFVTQNIITLAMFISLQAYIWKIDEIIYSFGDLGKNYSKVKVALTRIDEIINNKLYDDEKYGTKELKNGTGLLKLENVHFKYEKDTNYTLCGMNLECKPNQKTAIIGKSGNGKSTIYNLLVRYFDPTEGKITIDNININELTENSLRHNISIIRQNPHIFNMTIIENLRLVKPKATNNEIYEVCKQAYIHDYISSLPEGYNTMIGEGGVNLSGGQKQRLAIARTLLLNTKIILFDEATSALDNESQKYIKQTIDNLAKDHTIIIVAHRLSTIIDADIINIVEKGKIKESGTHKELLKNSKTYNSLYKNES